MEESSIMVELGAVRGGGRLEAEGAQQQLQRADRGKV